ncbi:hypothetical protein Tcan_16457 [Toxocara canis]|uniref:Uncharacterized protein n=1 Tax=Toxocara canis TaxID=6265 RepID=A0A0B2W2H5_TOXCA|nr:hypothetical protein Tcan_16457 [Toxocara canis]
MWSSHLHGLVLLAVGIYFFVCTLAAETSNTTQPTGSTTDQQEDDFINNLFRKEELNMSLPSLANVRATNPKYIQKVFQEKINEANFSAALKKRLRLRRSLSSDGYDEETKTGSSENAIAAKLGRLLRAGRRHSVLKGNKKDEKAG